MRHAERRRSRTPEDVGAPWSAPLLSAGANAPAHERLAALTVLLMAIATPVAVGFHDVFHGGTWLFLVPRVYRFGDYFRSYDAIVGFQPGKFDTMVYSPIMHLLMTALTYLPARAGFVVVVAVFVAVLVLVCWKWITAVTTFAALRLVQVAVLVLLSYPVLFVIDRGKVATRAGRGYLWRWQSAASTTGLRCSSFRSAIGRSARACTRCWAPSGALS